MSTYTVGTPTVTMKQMAAILKVSYRHMKRMKAAGLIGPVEISLGRLVRYPYWEVQEWIQAGCPRREAWQKRTQSQRVQEGK